MPMRDEAKQREYQKLWVQKRRADFFEGKECAWCGSKTDLIIHHVNPAEKKSHRVWSWTQDKREEELRKCIVLCTPCHIKHHAELDATKKHGTRGMYRRSKCRCEKCRAWKLQDNRKYKAIQKDKKAAHARLKV